MRTAVVVFGVLGQNGDAYFLLNDVHAAQRSFQKAILWLCFINVAISLIWLGI